MQTKSCAALRYCLQARKQILMHSFLGITRFQSKTNMTSEIGLRKGLNEVSENSFAQGAYPDMIIRVGGDEDSWDHLARLDEILIELDPGHARHIHVGD